MKKHTLLSTSLFMGVLFSFFACLDKLPVPDNSLDCSTVTITYTNHVKGILDRGCNISGCHDDANQISFGSYASVTNIRGANIYHRVCITKDMPPAGTTTAIVDTIRCWKEGGYLE